MSEYSEQPEPTEKYLSVTEHMVELRTRLIRSVIAISIGFVIGWIFRQDLLFLLKDPLLTALPDDSHQMVLLRVMDKFFIDIKIAFFGGLFIAAPYIVFEIWGFVSPGLYSNEKRYALPFLIGSIFFFAAGVAFCYFAVLPIGMDFLVTYSTNASDFMVVGDLTQAVPNYADKLQVSLLEYVGFVSMLMLVFGLAFELPLILTLLSLMGVIDTKWLASKRKYAIVLAFVFAALVTPPDPLSQAAMGISLFMLYELSIWLTYFLRKKKTGD